MRVLVSAETLEADLRGLAVRLGQHVAESVAAWRRTDDPAQAQHVYTTGRQLYALTAELADILGDPTVRRPWPRAVLSEVEERLPAATRLVKQRTPLKPEWRDKLDALRRLRAPSS